MLRELIRLPLRLIPKEAAVPVLSGGARGLRWVVGAHTHGCWLGTYERGFQREFSSRVRPGDVVFDVGANAGYYTLIASRLVGATGRVIAFEPLPENCRFVRRHLDINHVRNTELFEAAVSDAPGRVRFSENKDRAQNSISESGGLEVEAVSLDALWKSGCIPLPTLVKIDVEGAEARVLAGAAELIAQARPTIFLATHGDAVREACLSRLKALGYQFRCFGDIGMGADYLATAGEAK